MGVAIACTTTGGLQCARQMVPPERRAWAFGISAAAGSVRPVLHDPGRSLFITQNRLVSVADRAGRHHRHHLRRWAGISLARQRRQAAATGGRDAGQRRRSTTHCVRRPQLHAADAGLLRVRLPGGFIGAHLTPYSARPGHRRARRRHCASRWSACSTASAPISRACSPARCPSATCLVHLLPCARW